MLHILVPADFGAEAVPDGREQFGTTLGRRVGVAIFLDRLDCRGLEQIRHGKVRLADREVDRILHLRRKVEHLANPTGVNRVGSVGKELGDIEAIGDCVWHRSSARVR